MRIQFNYNRQGRAFRSTDFSRQGLESERSRLKSEFFNAFNNPHFANPYTSLGNAAFGRISSTALTSREIQLGLKLTF